MSRRRGSAIIPILLVLIILGAVAIATVKVYNKLNIFGNWLTEEFVPENVVVRGVFSIDYGKIYEVTATKEGWKLQEANKAIYEKIVLSRIDLEQNDVIAPHLYDWYFDGQDDYIEFHGLPYGGYNVSAVETIIVKFMDPQKTTWEKLVTEYYYHDGTYHNSGLQVGEGGWSGNYYIQAGTGQGDSQDIGYFTNINIDIEQWYEIAFSVKVDVDPKAWYWTSDCSCTCGAFNEGPRYGWLLGGVTTVRVAFSNCWTGYISYVAMKYEVNWTEPFARVLNSPKYLLDPTFFNGTRYFDLVTGASGAAYGGVQRTPAEQMWLWLVKQLASDNKVHFMWFPQGSIIRIQDSSGNVIRQFVIDGTPINDNGQIEDYAIDLPSASISQATVEAWIPSMKIRVYGPPSAKVEVVKSNVIYGSGIIGASGYVDIQLSQKLDNAEIWICAEKSDKNLKLDIKEDGDNLVVAVLDENNILVPNALVLCKDAAGVVIAYAETDDSGQVIFSKSELLSGLFSKELTFSAQAIWNSKYYESKEVSYTLATTSVGTEIGEHLAENKEKSIMYGLGLLAIILFVMILARARRR